MKLINLKCETCGAQLKRTATMRSLECEYCGSKYLGEFAGERHGMEAETYMLPVELEENRGMSTLLNTIRNTQFIHEKAEAIISQATPRGVMVPCYCFECEVTSNWQGENSVDKSRQVFNPVTGTYDTQIYKEWYPQNGQHYGTHAGFIAASGALKESESWGLFPLPVEKKFLFIEDDENQRFSLEIPNMMEDQAWIKGEKVIRFMEENECKKLVEKLKNVNSRIDTKKSSLIYSPLWIFNYTVDNIPYRNVVCAVRGNVIGETPTNFGELINKLRILKNEIDQKNNYFLISLIGAIILFVSMVGFIFALAAGGAAYYFYSQLNKLKEEFNNYIGANKYNLCYYILRQRRDIRETLGNIPGVEMVERCIDEEEGGKIDNFVAKTLVEKFLIATKPLVTENESRPQSVNDLIKKTKEKINSIKENIPGEESGQTVKIKEEPLKSDFDYTEEEKIQSEDETIIVKYPEQEEQSQTFCPDCGKDLKPEWRACPICGNKII